MIWDKARFEQRIGLGGIGYKWIRQTIILQGSLFLMNARDETLEELLHRVGPFGLSLEVDEVGYQRVGGVFHSGCSGSSSEENERSEELHNQERSE
jgi:hypothetical protein